MSHSPRRLRHPGESLRGKYWCPFSITAAGRCVPNDNTFVARGKPPRPPSGSTTSLPFHHKSRPTKLPSLSFLASTISHLQLQQQQVVINVEDDEENDVEQTDASHLAVAESTVSRQPSPVVLLDRSCCEKESHAPVSKDNHDDDGAPNLRFEDDSQKATELAATAAPNNTNGGQQNVRKAIPMGQGSDGRRWVEEASSQFQNDPTAATVPRGDNDATGTSETCILMGNESCGSRALSSVPTERYKYNHVKNRQDSNRRLVTNDADNHIRKTLTDEKNLILLDGHDHDMHYHHDQQYHHRGNHNPHKPHPRKRTAENVPGFTRNKRQQVCMERQRASFCSLSGMVPDRHAVWIFNLHSTYFRSLGYHAPEQLVADFRRHGGVDWFLRTFSSTLPVHHLDLLNQALQQEQQMLCLLEQRRSGFIR